MTKWTACSLADWDMEASLQRLCTGQAFVSLPRINICYCCRIIGRHEAQAECGENAPSALVAAQEERVAECPGRITGLPRTPSHAGAAAHSGFCR